MEWVGKNSSLKMMKVNINCVWLLSICFADEDEKLEGKIYHPITYAYTDQTLTHKKNKNASVLS